MRSDYFESQHNIFTIKDAPIKPAGNEINSTDEIQLSNICPLK